MKLTGPACTEATSGAEEAGRRERAEGSAGGVRVERRVRHRGSSLGDTFYMKTRYLRLVTTRGWQEKKWLGGLNSGLCHPSLDESVSLSANAGHFSQSLYSGHIPSTDHFHAVR
jgi:hypothetical protein